MMRPEERKLLERHIVLISMFATQEGELWIYNTRDPEEWQLYLWTRRN